MAKVSFDKVSLIGLFPKYWPVGTDIYARLMYLETADTKMLLVSMDTLCTYRSDVIAFRKAVSDMTGIPQDGIWYHELQTHATPDWDTLTGQPILNIAEAVGKKVLQMKENAVDFTCEVAEVYAGMKYTVNREQYIAGLGGVTVWLGFDYTEDGRVYSQKPSRMLLRGYDPKLPVYDKPIWFDNPVDPRAYLFVFKDGSGNIIGSVSRFAAHPDVAVLFEHLGGSDYHYDYDWPGYLSAKLEAEFGAPSMYVNGPCANLATKKRTDDQDNYEKSALECKRIGEEFADMLLAGFYKKTVPLGDADNLKLLRFEVKLPLQEDFPASKEAYDSIEDPTLEEAGSRHASEADAAEKQQIVHPQTKEEAAEEVFQAAIAEHAPAYRVKQLADERWKATMRRHHVYALDKIEPEAFETRRFTVEISAMQLGDYLFVGVPGESLTEMSDFLRSNFSGVKTVPLDQVGGYFDYFASPTTLTLGGYTYWQSWLSREAIPLLKDKIMEHMADFI